MLLNLVKVTCLMRGREENFQGARSPRLHSLSAREREYSQGALYLRGFCRGPNSRHVLDGVREDCPDVTEEKGHTA